MQTDLFTKVSLYNYSYEQNTAGEGARTKTDNEKKNHGIVTR